MEAWKPLTIEDDVGPGRSAVIHPGVTPVGAHIVIKAASVITKDIPADIGTARNPRRVMRHLKENQETALLKSND